MSKLASQKKSLKKSSAKPMVAKMSASKSKSAKKSAVVSRPVVKARVKMKPKSSNKPVFGVVPGVKDLNKTWVLARNEWLKAIKEAIKLTGQEITLLKRSQKEERQRLKKMLQDNAKASTPKTLAAKNKLKKTLQLLKQQQSLCAKQEKTLVLATQSLVDLQALLLKAKAVEQAIQDFEAQWLPASEVPADSEVMIVETKPAMDKPVATKAKKVRKKTKSNLEPETAMLEAEPLALPEVSIEPALWTPEPEALTETAEASAEEEVLVPETEEQL